MRNTSLFISSLCGLILSVLSVNAQKASIKDSLGSAPVPGEIQNSEITGIHKEAAHATLIPYATLQEALMQRKMLQPTIGL